MKLSPMIVTEKSTRPVGPPDRCFYCDIPIGGIHKPECVMISRRIRVRAVIEYETEAPASWDKQQIEFHRNDSSWCADNLVGELERLRTRNDEEGRCFCASSVFEFLEYTSDPFLSER